MIDAFAKIWGTDELLVSFGMSLYGEYVRTFADGKIRRCECVSAV